MAVRFVRAKIALRSYGGLLVMLRAGFAVCGYNRTYRACTRAPLHHQCKTYVRARIGADDGPLAGPTDEEHGPTNGLTLEPPYVTELQ